MVIPLRIFLGRKDLGSYPVSSSNPIRNGICCRFRKLTSRMGVKFNGEYGRYQIAIFLTDFESSAIAFSAFLMSIELWTDSGVISLLSVTSEQYFGEFLAVIL